MKIHLMRIIGHFWTLSHHFCVQILNFSNGFCKISIFCSNEEHNRANWVIRYNKCSCPVVKISTGWIIEFCILWYIWRSNTLLWTNPWIFNPPFCTLSLAQSQYHWHEQSTINIVLNAFRMECQIKLFHKKLTQLAIKLINCLERWQKGSTRCLL